MSNKRSAIILSHGPGCFDGTTCAVAVARYYGSHSLLPQFTHPSHLDSVIETLATTRSDPHDLWITDLAWKHQSTDAHLRRLIDNGWKIFWIDHHRNAIEKLESDISDIHLTGHVVSTVYAASRLLFNFLITQPSTSPEAFQWLSRLRKVVMLADEHDRWLHNGRESESMRLALAIEQLAHPGNGLKGYRMLLDINADATLTPELTRAYNVAKTELETSLRLAMHSKRQHVVSDLNLTIVYARCNKYASQVGNALRVSTHNAVIILLNESDRRYSLRKSTACDVNLASVATFLGGGGHSNAAGFQLIPYNCEPTECIQKVENAIRVWHTAHKLHRAKAV